MDSDFLAEYVHGRHTVDDYFDRFVREVEFKAAVDGFSTDLRNRCSAALRSAFARLDALPRTDPLWARSNNRATFTKLREHPELLGTDDSDLESCWGSFIIALCSGHPERFGAASEVLLRTRQLQVTDFLLASYNLHGKSGDEAEDVTAVALARLDLGAVARSELYTLTWDPSRDRSLWAEKILERLGFDADRDTLERVAEVEHEQWVFWSKSIAAEVSPERRARWEKYWIPYQDLPDDVKEDDRIWARKAIKAARR
jgi:hypothetical protein